MDEKMDKLDFLILRELQKDGTMSLTIIAKKLNVSIGTIRNRLARLMEDKTVQIIGRIDPNKVGFHAYSRIFISVKPAKIIEQTAQKLSTFPEVSFLAMISGKYDLELNVQCRDNDHLIELMEKIHALEGILKQKPICTLKCSNSLSRILTW